MLDDLNYTLFRCKKILYFLISTVLRFYWCIYDIWHAFRVAYEHNLFLLILAWAAVSLL